MSKTTKILLTVIVLLLITALAFYPKLKPFLTGEKKEGKSDKPTDAKGGGGKGGPTFVEVLVISASKLEEKIQSTGTIIPNEEVEIRSEILGRITHIGFKEGDYVSKGQVLIRIYDDDLQAQLQKLGFQKKLAEVNEERQKKLLEKEAISQREYDVSFTSLNSVNADIENLKAQLSKTVIKAPFNGKVGLRYVSLGSYLSPATKIATLTSRIPAKIDFSIPAKYANNVQKGTSIQFGVEGDSTKYGGNVYAVEPKIDPNTRSLVLRAISPNTSGKLTPGAFARVEIVLNARSNAIVVPTEAVIPDLKGHRVFVVKNNKAEPVIVEVGIRNEKTVEITSGLSVGDSLVTSGILQVKPGGEVKVKGN
jgi:membrane fusion protein, multidrug efflux system